MAERKISTKLVVDGEKELTTAISRISAEYKTLKSQMELVDSKYKGQSNTVEALEAKNKALTDTISKLIDKVKAENDALNHMKDIQQKAAQQTADIKAKIEEKTTALEKLKQASGDTTAEEEKLKEEIKKLGTELAGSIKAEEQAALMTERHQTAANKAEAEINKLNGELSKNEKYLDEAKNSADGCATSIDEMGKEIKGTGDEAEKMGQTTEDAINDLASALAAAGVAATIKEIAEALRECVDASVEYESAFAGVKKTVEASSEEFGALSDGIKEMTTRIPASTTEIAGVAEAAGQLGIKTEDIMDFTETMVNLGVATNLSSDEAATALAKFANVVNMSPDSYKRLGSTIVALGNNFATTEADIVHMATRLASTGAVVGLSEPQIMAVATAVSSLGMEAEAGGTAVSKLLKKMEVAAKTYDTANTYIGQTGMSLRELQLLADADGKSFKALAQDLGLTSTELKGYMANAQDMEKFSNVAKVTAEEFAQAWSGDPIKTLDIFVTGLGEIDKAGGSAVGILEEMGMTQVNLSNAVLSMAKSDNILTKSLNLSSKAWVENTALAKEAGQRYSTTESKFKLFENSVSLLKIAVGDKLTPALGDLAETGADVINWAADFVESNGDVVYAVSGVATAITILGGGLTVLSVAKIPAVTAAFQTLTTVMAANPWLIAAAAIGGVVAAFGTMVSSAYATAEEMRASTDSLLQSIEDRKTAFEATTDGVDKQSREIEGLIKHLDELTATENKSEAQKQELAAIVEKLNELMPDLGIAYDETTDSINKSTDAIKAYAEQQAEAAYQTALGNERIALLTDQYEIEYELKQAQEDLAAAQTAYNEALGTYIERGGGYTTYIEAAAAVDVAQGEVNDLTEAMQSNADALEDVEGKINAVTEATDNGAQATADYAQEAVASFEAVDEELLSLIQAYNDVYMSAYDAITKTIGQFQLMEETVGVAVDDVIEALDSQIEFMNTYAENLKAAAELGIDDGLIRALSNGSVESAQILQGIVDDGGENMDELNEKFASVEKGKQDFSDTVAEMETNFKEKADSIVEKTNEMVQNFNQQGEAYAAGAATVQGYIDGMNSMLSEFDSISNHINSVLTSTPTTPIKPSDNNPPKMATGFPYIPYDNYPAMLHQGERVLTAFEARAYRATQNISNIDNTSNKSTVTFGDIIVNVSGGKGGAQAGRDAAAQLERELRYKGVVLK